MSAPTGQISMVLPMNLLTTGASDGVPIWLWYPRSKPFSASSPARISPNRTHRQQRMHRSRSRTSTGPIGMCFRKVRLASMNLLWPGPNRSVLSWSGHSPPLSQMGQSRGWFARRNSRMPRCPSLTRGVWVRTTMSSPASCVQEVTSLGIFSISTRHIRHAPSGGIRSW